MQLHNYFIADSLPLVLIRRPFVGDIYWLQDTLSPSCASMLMEAPSTSTRSVVTDNPILFFLAFANRQAVHLHFVHV